MRKMGNPDVKTAGGIKKNAKFRRVAMSLTVLANARQSGFYHFAISCSPSIHILTNRHFEP
jgi:hypothetical protein